MAEEVSQKDPTDLRSGVDRDGLPQVEVERLLGWEVQGDIQEKEKKFLGYG